MPQADDDAFDDSLDDEPLADEAEAAPFTWPCCPQCGRRRLAICPVCQTSGTDFEHGFAPGADRCPLNDPEQPGPRRVRPLVLCPICDEAFRPRFLARCEWCGHDYGDGQQLPPTLAAEPVELDGRVIAAVLGTVAGVALLIAYFAWIFRR